MLAQTDAPSPEEPMTGLQTAASTPPGGSTRVVIPPYGQHGTVRRGGIGWWRVALALAAYFLLLWLVVIPSYPLPLLAKAALGFLVAGGAAGSIVPRRGWLVALIGFGLVLALCLIAAGITLGLAGLGPAFLLNGATAGGNVDTVDKVRPALLRSLVGFTLAAAVLSALGGAAGSAAQSSRARR